MTELNHEDQEAQAIRQASQICHKCRSLHGFHDTMLMVKHGGEKVKVHLGTSKFLLSQPVKRFFLPYNCPISHKIKLVSSSTSLKSVYMTWTAKECFAYSYYLNKTLCLHNFFLCYILREKKYFRLVILLKQFSSPNPGFNSVIFTVYLLKNSTKH